MGAKRASPTHSTATSKRQKTSKPVPSAERSSKPTKLSTKPVGQRIRFSSASPPPPIHIDEPPVTTETPIAEADDLDSDSDSAPEDVTTTAAAAQAKASASSLAKAQKKEREATKQRRRERDAKLKAQTQDRPKKRREASPSSSAEDGLNDLLPDDILNDPTLFNRPPTPEPEPKKKRERPEKRNKVVKLDVKEKKPKDVVKNGVTVSVLGKQSRVLPPKSNKTGMNVRRQWIEESRGFHGRRRLGLTK